MSTQSGISASEELLEAFKHAQGNDVRVLKVLIEQERLVPSSTLPVKGSDLDDFDAIPALLEPASAPAYILVKLDSSSTLASDSSEWLLATYVPDHAQVRAKMLYSSTKATLARQLGEGSFKYTLFASSPDELSSQGYKRFLAHQSSTAPMTHREREMADIKAAEGTEVIGSSARRSHAGASVGMEWAENAVSALESLASQEASIVQLGIDLKQEQIVLLDTPQELSVPKDDPSYTFYRHSAGIVFIYCCPDTSPVRGRMMYSANCQPVVQEGKQRGLDVVKKLETSTPSEITVAYVDSEVSPPKSEPGSGAATPTTSFARPARPGRKR